MKFLKFFCYLLLLVFVVGCGSGDGSKAEQVAGLKDSKVIKVGASPVPHAAILENIKPYLKEKGITLEVIEFNDYVLPNLSLNDGSIDANFFQHQPYLDKMIEDKHLSIESIAKVHVEPIAAYSNKINSIADLGVGATIAIPNDPSNSGRSLILLHNSGIIKLKDPSNLYSTELDVIDNPKDIKFKQLEAALLPKVLDDVDVAIINANYALQAGINFKGALIVEDSKSPYANILAVRIDDKREELLALKEALNSKLTRDFIVSTYNGELVPAFEAE